ncbi:uncharacterized protein LOC6565520 [Drosophila grimshawi]|uniref:GH12059 n=1 Tax=Drosophila grimshawi TaxID=7222 RepID=B4JKF5_DROGR|nr:uncharacterized protein LOC6565520 [Drosophila grimshawi]EDW00058.1 GH12059 [Drosophila grimshawi]
MHICDGYLMHMLLLLVLVAGEALPHQKSLQQPQQRNRDDAKRVGNDYGPVIYISSAVLQLAPDDKTQLLLLPLAESSSTSSSSYHPILPHIYALDGLLPVPAAHQPRLTISDNLDFQERNTNNVKSHGH